MTLKMRPHPPVAMTTALAQVYERAVLARVSERSDPSFLLEELGDGRLHVDLGVGGEDLLLHGPYEFEPRTVPNVAQAPIGVWPPKERWLIMPSGVRLKSAPHCSSS